MSANYKFRPPNFKTPDLDNCKLTLGISGFQSTKGVGSFLMIDRGLRSVPGVDGNIAWQGKQLLMDTVDQRIKIAAWQIGPADAIEK